MTQPKVSIIIPVYNIERYLRRCLDSVIHQTLNDIAIICVNDGSTDSSLAILKEYEKNDPRVRVVDKENEGQGIARNIGIDMAQGEYIGFVDGDDWIEADMYERMYSAAKKNDADLHLCSVKRVDSEGGDLGIRCDYEQLIGKKFGEDAIFTWQDAADAIFRVGRFCWNKIYKKSFLTNHGIRFSTIRCYEDNIFHFRAFFEAKTISMSRAPLYFYMINRQGASSSKSKQISELFKANREVEKYLEENHAEKGLVQRFENYRIRRYLTYCYIIGKADRKQFFDRVKSDFCGFDIKDNPFVKGPEKIFYIVVRTLPYGLFKYTYMPGYLCFHVYMKLWLKNLTIDPLDVV